LKLRIFNIFPANSIFCSKFSANVRVKNFYDDTSQGLCPAGKSLQKTEFGSGLSSWTSTIVIIIIMLPDGGFSAPATSRQYVRAIAGTPWN
jgi:hypothetical protein